MSLGSVGSSSAAQLVVGLGGGDEFILRFASAVGSTKGVVAHTGNIGAFALSALLDQHQTALLGSAERVGSVAGAGDSVLKPIYQLNPTLMSDGNRKISFFYLDGAEESAVSLANLSSSNVHLKLGGQTLLDVDGPFGIRSVSIESGDLNTINFGCSISVSTKSFPKFENLPFHSRKRF